MVFYAPLFIRNRVAGCVERNQLDLRLIAGEWNADGRAAKCVVINNQVDPDAAHLLAPAGEQKVFEPNARMKKLWLMPRDEQRRRRLDGRNKRHIAVLRSVF